MAEMKSWYTILKNRLGLFPLLVTFLLIVLLIYFSVSTRWIPTTNRINTTDAYNLTIEVDGIYSYVYNDYIIKKKYFEDYNTQIPKGSLEPEKSLFLIILIISLVASLVSRKERSREPAKKKEVENRAREILNKEKEEDRIKDYEILTQGALHRRQIGDGKLEPNLWMIPAKYTMPNEDEEYHLLLFEPFTIQLYEDKKLDKEFSGEDRCDKCGSYSNLKIIRPQDLKVLDELFGWIKK